MNCWSDETQFFATGIIDSEEFFWRRFWLELEVVDANGQPLTVKNEAITVVPAHSTGTAPRGRTAFFWAWKRSDINGIPDSVHLRTAKSIAVDAGPILLISNQGGVRMLVGGDSLQQEKSWMVTGTVENPLPLISTDPHIDILLFGNDNKLWFAQPISMNRDTSIIKTNLPGDIPPTGRRDFGMNIYYDALPKPLVESRIGRVEIMAFEGR